MGALLERSDAEQHMNLVRWGLVGHMIYTQQHTIYIHRTPNAHIIWCAHDHKIVYFKLYGHRGSSDRRKAEILVKSEVLRHSWPRQAFKRSEADIIRREQHIRTFHTAKRKS